MQAWARTEGEHGRRVVSPCEARRVRQLSIAAERPSSTFLDEGARGDHAEVVGKRQSEDLFIASRTRRLATGRRFHRESWCVPKKHGLHFGAPDGPVFIEKTGRSFNDHLKVSS